MVTHLQYLSWPDHGAPEETDFVIISRILDFIQEFHEMGSDQKIVLHCSAGIGRTGSLIAIYNLQSTAMALADYYAKSKSNFP